jgi:hypothetical protein
MCFLPVGAEAVQNPAGVAPGMILRLTGGAAVVSVPGRPEESKAVFEAAMLRLRDLFPLRASAERELEAPTSDESAMRPVLDRLTEEFPGVWVKSHPPATRRKDPIRVTLQSFAATQKEADTLVEILQARLDTVFALVHALARGADLVLVAGGDVDRDVVVAEPLQKRCEVCGRWSGASQTRESVRAQAGHDSPPGHVARRSGARSCAPRGSCTARRR